MNTQVTDAPAKPRRGRKPARESRAPEIRRRVAEWSLTPPERRQPSTLTELAQELGISHQLASYCASRTHRECFGRAQAIADKARSEGRCMTAAEEQEWREWKRTALNALALGVVRRAARAGDVRSREFLRKRGQRSGRWYIG